MDATEKSYNSEIRTNQFTFIVIFYWW